MWVVQIIYLHFLLYTLCISLTNCVRAPKDRKEPRELGWGFQGNTGPRITFDVSKANTLIPRVKGRSKGIVKALLPTPELCFFCEKYPFSLNRGPFS